MLPSIAVYGNRNGKACYLRPAESNWASLNSYGVTAGLDHSTPIDTLLRLSIVANEDFAAAIAAMEELVRK